MYRVLSNEAPEYISNRYIRTPHAILAPGTVSLVCLDQEWTYSKQVSPSLRRFLWNTLPLTLSCSKRKLRAHLEAVK